MTLPNNVYKVLDDYNRNGITGKVVLEFREGNLSVVRPKLSGIEVERIAANGGHVSFLEGMR